MKILKMIKELLLFIFEIIFFLLGLICSAIAYWATTLNVCISLLFIVLMALFWTITVWLINKLQ